MWIKYNTTGSYEPGGRINSDAIVRLDIQGTSQFEGGFRLVATLVNGEAFTIAEGYGDKADVVKLLDQFNTVNLNAWA
jgi:hypothetical protein